MIDTYQNSGNYNMEYYNKYIYSCIIRYHYNLNLSILYIFKFFLSTMRLPKKITMSLRCFDQNVHNSLKKKF